MKDPKPFVSCRSYTRARPQLTPFTGAPDSGEGLKKKRGLSSDLFSDFVFTR
jgi:hypothetical protein